MVIKSKNIITVFLLFAFICSQVNAFGGYTHYYITSKVIEETPEFEILSDEEKLAYKSGSVIADIGWFNWDLVYPDSDGKVFKDKMIEIAAQSEDSKTKLFALGWSDHLIQDENTVRTFKAVFKKPIGSVRYRINCGKLDAYFYNKFKYIWADTLFINYNLIREVYSVFKSKKSDNIIFHTNPEIYNEIWKIFWTFYGQSYLGVFGLNKSEIQKTESAVKEVCSKCGKNNSDYSILFR